jgi:hypothetical protein
LTKEDNTGGNYIFSGHTWAFQPSAAVGNPYFVRYTKNSGAGVVSNAGVWVALTSDVTFILTSGAGQVKSALGTYEISTTASAAGIVGSGAMNLFAESAI